MITIAFSLALSVIAFADAEVFNVRDFGARGDGVTLDTAAVRAVASEVQRCGGGVILFPAVGSNSRYLTGAFNLSSNAVLRIEAGATVLGSTDGADWPLVVAASVWPQFGASVDCNRSRGGESCRLMHQSLVFAWGSDNLTIEGGGALDCNAQPDTWWTCVHDLSLPPCSGYGRPNCLLISNATQVTMRDITVRNSPSWTLHFSSVQTLRVRNISVLNPGTGAPNADGIDIDSSQDVIVEDSYFSVGDDALCIKSGIDYFGRLYGRPSKDIIFRRITIGTGHGITVGSETSGGVTNATFEDIVMHGTLIGIRIKTQRGRGGVVSGLTYRNISMYGITQQCVQITNSYQRGIAPTNATATPVLRDVLLENVSCESAGSSYVIEGLPERWIENLQFRNVVLGDAVGKEQTCEDAECWCDTATHPCPSCCSRQSMPSAVVV